jgi:hypothetical protein
MFNNKVLILEILNAGIFLAKRIKADPTIKKVPIIKADTGAKARNTSCGVEVNNSIKIIRR